MQRRSQRRGASILESALTLPVFLILVLGTLDLGMGVFRQHTISAAARSGARLAIVHGYNAPDPTGSWSGPWGSQTIDVPLSDSNVPIAVELRPLLVASNPD